MWALKRGFDPDETWEVWIKEHAPWARKLLLPEARRYTIGHVIHRFDDMEDNGIWDDICGMTQIYFDDVESCKRAMGRILEGPKDEFMLTREENLRSIIMEEREIDMGFGIVPPHLPLPSDADMVRYHGIYSLNRAFDPDETWEAYKVHPKFAVPRLLPEGRRYTQARVIYRFGDPENKHVYDDIYGMSRVYFDDLESCKRAMGRILGKPQDDFVNKRLVNLHGIVLEQMDII
jgi:hypothetical protein